MPIYEYECVQCGKRFERIQKFSDPPVEVCPSCGAKVNQLISPPGLRFKGSGWYVTDYARKSTGGEKAQGETKADDSSAKLVESDKKESPAEKKSSEK